ncbi:hypothetical protein [Bacillus cereus]|uniref:hypothetical protein n=1 Tax=Bacillus cereus TaxID=1396 RepID=UPI0025AF8BE3|nr:hypothetical protein [Bacillus cereus]WJX08114.1 hypothetical protein QTA68_29940 [Bacillus cereus]
MELIVFSFVLVVIFFILSIVLSGKGQRIAKEVLKELINGPEGKMLVVFFGTGAVIGVIFIIWLLLN